jgi:hypothetical protein
MIHVVPLGMVVALLALGPDLVPHQVRPTLGLDEELSANELARSRTRRQQAREIGVGGRFLKKLAGGEARRGRELIPGDGPDHMVPEEVPGAKRT